MQEKLVRITTDDTHQTFTFPGKPGEKPDQIWEVQLQIRCISVNDKLYPAPQPFSGGTVIHLLRETLEEYGLLPNTKPKPPPEPVEANVTELALRFLAHLGVYPTE